MEFFPGAKPARTMVKFGADIPGVLVAIDAIALACGPVRVQKRSEPASLASPFYPQEQTSSDHPGHVRKVQPAQPDLCC